MLALPWNGSKVNTIEHHRGLLAQINRKMTSDQTSIPYHHLQLHHQQQTRTTMRIFFPLSQKSGTVYEQTVRGHRWAKKTHSLAKRPQNMRVRKAMKANS
jgi:hypothetical protein